MNQSEARAICKAINRHVNKVEVFMGGRQFGVDFNTWAVCYPQMCREFRNAAAVVVGRPGRFLPRFR